MTDRASTVGAPNPRSEECHYEISLGAYERALQPNRLVTVKGGHFVYYVEQFSPASKEAVASFQEYLM
jgi:hypothetical protein